MRAIYLFIALGLLISAALYSFFTYKPSPPPSEITTTAPPVKNYVNTHAYCPGKNYKRISVNFSNVRAESARELRNAFEAERKTVEDLAKANEAEINNYYYTITQYSSASPKEYVIDGNIMITGKNAAKAPLLLNELKSLNFNAKFE